MFWILLTMFFVVLEAAIWTAPSEFWTVNNGYFLAAAGISGAVLMLLMFKRGEIVVRGRIGKETGDGSCGTRLYSVPVFLSGIVASAVISACLLGFLFTNAPVTDRLCRQVWAQVLLFRDVQLPEWEKRLDDTSTNQLCPTSD